MLKQIDSLKLTTAQEVELSTYMTMLYKICHIFTRKGTSVYLLDYDDLVQQTSIKLIKAIKSELCRDSKTKVNYYKKVIYNGCLTELKKVRRKNSIIISVDDSDFKNTLIYNSLILESLANTEYVNVLLSYIESNYCKKILMYYYGINTCSKNSVEIGLILKKSENAIRIAKSYTIKKLRKKIKHACKKV